MTISAVSSNVFVLTGRSNAVEKQAKNDAEPHAAPVLSGATPATNTTTGQNVPANLSDETNAALLALQEVGTSTQPDPSQELKLKFQGQVITAKRLTVGNPVRIAELPEAQYKDAMEGLQRMLEMVPMREDNLIPPDPSYMANHPALKTYATVEVGGKVVATIDNQGVMSSSNQVSAKVQPSLPNDVNGTSGPNLAQARAEKVAALLGGKVVKARTAITQAQFDANPIDPEKLRPQPNLEAIKQDPLYARILDIQKERAAFLEKQSA